MSWRTRKDGRRYQKRQRTLFNSPPAHKRLSEEISIENGSQARESVRILNQRLRSNPSRENRVLLVRAANQAANRAAVISQNPAISSEQRRQASDASQVYRGFVNENKIGR